jgi:DNA relaxase NicK
MQSTTKKATPRITNAASRVFVHWLAVSFRSDDADTIIDNFCHYSGIAKHVRSCSDAGALIAYHAKSGVYISNQNSMLLKNRHGHNTYTLILNGKDCLVIKRWKLLIAFLKALPNAQINRVDISKDFKTGISLSDIKAAHRNGEFSIYGQNPTMRSIGEFEHDDGIEARTVEIGKRENGKSLRVYEIGRKIKSKNRSEVRLEVEFRSSKSRTIPFEVLANPESFFAGTYPYLSQFCNGKTAKMDFRKAEKNYDYLRKIEALKNAFGPTVNLILAVEGSPLAVVDLIRRDGFPSGMTPKNIKAITVPPIKLINKVDKNIPEKTNVYALQDNSSCDNKLKII